MTIYFIKCESGYWAGMSHYEKGHVYTNKKENAAQFLDRDKAESVASSWLTENPLIYMRVDPIEPFEIEAQEYEPI